jgi:hypothetical protein
MLSFELQTFKSAVLGLGGGGGISCAEGLLPKHGFCIRLVRGVSSTSCVEKLAKSFSTLNLALVEPKDDDKASVSSEAALLLRPTP